eukprot:CAMPEP_0115467364 /NCGR_PEP_ID=MMETSP0271-20121206/50402_1 /TAXON_ID=71861 /ORGANISM="Scrippsiella trochoidea, Strain CCMP3099" /LENGTH=35 /DNA_ID= /DNA_START= /DNA_END= /DNA_ORIENTATION=
MEASDQGLILSSKGPWAREHYTHSGTSCARVGLPF